MPIVVNLDIMMARRKITLGELAEKIDITPANLSILKTGKAKAIRFSTLEVYAAKVDVYEAKVGVYGAKVDVCETKLSLVSDNVKGRSTPLKVSFQ